MATRTEPTIKDLYRVPDDVKAKIVQPKGVVMSSTRMEPGSSMPVDPLLEGWRVEAKRRGFMLIELLVVIAILAILAVILFPVFAQARDAARTSSCLSNLRQLGVAMQLYLDSYDGVYPWNQGPRFTPSLIADRLPREDPTDRSNRWDGAPMVPLLAPFVKNDRLWLCPALPGPTPENGPGTSYQVNAFVFVNTIPEPERPHGGPVGQASLVAPSRLRIFQDFWNQARGIHRDGINAVCADGHTRWQRAGLGGPTVARWWQY